MPRTTVRPNQLSATELLNRRIGAELAAEFEELVAQETRRLTDLVESMRARFDELGPGELVILFEHEHMLAKRAKTKSPTGKSDPHLAVMSPAQRKAHIARELDEAASTTPARIAKAERKQAKRFVRWQRRAAKVLDARPAPVVAVVATERDFAVGLGKPRVEKGNREQLPGLAPISRAHARPKRLRAYSVTSVLDDDDDD